MILRKYDRGFRYRPLDVFTIDMLLFMAYDKHWKITETTPINMVPLELGNYYRFVNTPEPLWSPVMPDQFSRTFQDYRPDIETVDLQHVAEGGLYFIHWRVGWRSKAEELVVGLDRNNEYVHIERRDLPK